MVKLDDFQTKPNGEIWNLNIEDYNDDSRIYSRTKYKKKLDNGLQFKKSSTKILVQTSTGYTPNGIQDNHDDASHQGYMLAPNDYKNVIQFVTLDIKKIDKKKGTVSFAFRGGVREKDRRCEGCGYVLTYQRNGAVYVSKLQFYKGGEVEEKRQIGQVPLGTGKIGLGGVCYNVTENGKTKVVVKGLISSLENDEWVEIGKTIDEGGWGDSDKCSTTVDKILDFGSPIARFETSKIKDYVLMSAGIREIVAPGSENPDPVCKKGYYYNKEKKKCIPVLEPDPDIFEGEDEVKADAADIVGEVKIGATVVLDGSASSGPIKRHEWKQVLGPQATLEPNPLQFSNQFIVTPAMQGQTLEFQLTVFGEEATNIDSESISMVVEATQPQQPVINLTFPSIIEMLKTGTIDGTQSVADTLTLVQTTTKNINLAPAGTWKWTFTPPTETGSYELGFKSEAKKGNTVIQKSVQISVQKSGGGGTEEVLWDSNIHLKTGTKYTITDTHGSQAPDGKGVFMAASGDPRLIVDADGTFHLEADSGHGRVYIQACNYNARLEGECMFEDDNIRNTTWRLRSRHNEGGDCSNRFGGFGATHEKADQLAEYSTESCHNNHENTIKKALAKKLVKGQWVKFRFSVCDNATKTEVNFKTEYDYNDGAGWVTVLSGKHSSPQDYYMDEASFKARSYAWLRVNNEKTGSVAFRNVKIVKINSI